MIWFTYLISLLLFALSAPVRQDKITVAVAANAQYAMKELAAAYEKETGQPIELIVGSSGKLTAQIKQGAPFDVFLAADMEYPEALYKSGLTVAAPRVYGYGELVLWTCRKLAPVTMQALLSPNTRAVAIANPKVAPYGEAALSALRYYMLYQRVVPKLVYGESVSQVTQYIRSGAADMGFTAKAVVLSPELQGEGSWVDLDPKAYQPIAQGAVLLKGAQRQNGGAAEKFYHYLFSEKAKAILKKYGYQFKR